MADPKHDETFRVIDRRLFNEEGELRKDVPEQDRRTEDTPARKPEQARQWQTIIDRASAGIELRLMRERCMRRAGCDRDGGAAPTGTRQGTEMDQPGHAAFRCSWIF